MNEHFGERTYFVCHRKIGRYESTLVDALFDLFSMPSKVESKIEEDAARSIEGYQRT
jgi:hypothetical protein